MGIFALLLIMIMSALSSCGSMFTGTVTTTMASTYLSLPAEIDAADLSFTEKEMELQIRLTGLKLIIRNMMNTIITLVQSGMIRTH